MRQQGIDDKVLVETVHRLDKGLIEADLGGHLYKLRLARPGRGRSGGYRVIVVFRTRDRAVFVYGFAKNAKDNLSPGELAAYKMAAVDYLALTNAQFASLIAAGSLMEVTADA